MMTQMPRRRRSVLYIPASNARALEKAVDLPCDAIIIDLEDAVAPEAKADARLAARAMLETGRLVGKEVVVRVNGFPEGPEAPDLLADDLAAIVPAGPDAILFPKIRTEEDALRAASALDHNFAPPNVRLWLMIETPMAILNLAAITGIASAGDARLDCLVMGVNDLAKEMRVNVTSSRLSLLHALSASVIAARAYGIDVLDGVFGALQDGAGLEAECLQGRGLGFDGKTLIHPAQIEPANRIFAPSEAELRDARAIIDAFESQENRERSVIVVHGKMVERLHYEAARRVIALAG